MATQTDEKVYTKDDMHGEFREAFETIKQKFVTLDDVQKCKDEIKSREVENARLVSCSQR